MEKKKMKNTPSPSSRGEQVRSVSAVRGEQVKIFPNMKEICVRNFSFMKGKPTSASSTKKEYNGNFPSVRGDKGVFILMLVILAAISFPSFSQDRIDPRPLDSSLFSDTSIYDKDFHKRHFIRGWNFSGRSKKLDSALRINYYLTGATLDNLIQIEMDNKNLCGHRKAFQHYGILGNRKGDLLLNGQSLYLKPYITVDTNNYFEPKPEEGTGAVFGFLYKAVGDTLTEIINNNVFHIFRLKKDSITIGNPRVVLSRPWRDDILKYFNYDDKGRQIPNNSNIDGRIWYLTINLRSRDTVFNTLLMDSVVLTIRLRYKTNKGDTGSIMFCAFPNDTLEWIISERNTIRDTLGLTRRLTPVADNDTTQKEWKIRIKDLVTDTVNKRAGKFITLSANFENRGNDPNHHPNRRNPMFAPDGKKNSPSEYITNIDVVVTYHGHLDLSINYIRLETPRAQEIFRGKYDQAIADTLSRLNEAIRAHNSCNMRIHRFYTQDEPIPSEWATTRYVNKLLNGLGVVEENVNHNGYEIGSRNSIGKHFYRNFLRVTDFDMLWQGLTFGYSYLSNAPYIRRGKAAVFQCDAGNWYDGWHTYINYFNFIGGYKGHQWLVFHKPKGSDSCQHFSIHTGNSKYLDTLNSEYDINNLKDIFRKYLLDNSFFNGALYDRPWIAYLWTTSFYWDLYDKDVLKWPSSDCASCSGKTADSINFESIFLVPNKNANRPLTGEELRQHTWTPILLGAKGLAYWRNKVEIDRDRKFPASIGLLNYDDKEPNIPPGEDFVYSDSIGGDYIKSDGIIYNDWDLRWKNFFPQGISNTFRLDSLGIDSNHIYIGMKSNRAEIMKLHRWIEAVEDTLVKLKLLAWYYYGGQPFNDSSDVREIFYSQDPNVTLDTALKNYIKLDGITTRRIDNGVYDPDSLRFFLLTLFRWENDTTIFHETKLDEFYIGILNPRTDPLVRTFDTIRNEKGEILFIDSSMKFYSTAEYDIGVRYENYTHIWNPSKNSYEWRDTSYWQSLWWKRQGAREIRIPVNIPAADYMITVRELGAGVESLNREFWRDLRFYHRVDTMFKGKGEIVIRLLPGEGKILCISAFPKGRKNIHSNFKKPFKRKR